jgi:four helix bundle protein
VSNELKERTRRFALDVVTFSTRLPQRLETRHAIGQLIRASSSVAANYRAACRGKSRADFIAKLGTVEEEADESGFWLEMLRDILSVRNPALDVRTSDELERLRDEADQLVAIVVTSKKTASRHAS